MELVRPNMQSIPNNVEMLHVMARHILMGRVWDC